MQLLTIVGDILWRHTTSEMIFWTTIGAYFPEILRLYKLRTRRIAVESWFFFIVTNIFFPLLVGPSLAVAFEPANVLGALYAGASANVLLAAICSNVLEGQEEGLTSMSQHSKRPDSSATQIAALVRQVQEGDATPLEALFATTDLYVQAVVSRIVPYGHKEDVLQEVRLRVFQTITQCDPDRFRAWLAVVARNVAHDYMRRNRGVFSELSLDSAADRVESLEKAVDSGKLNADVLDNVRVMLASLSPRERKIVTLFYMFGYSYAEIASEESISEKTVQSFLAHARAKLRERVSAKKS